MPVQRELVVGRAAEFDELQADLEAALAGRGRLVLLSGAAGIGKTALAQRLIARASATDVPVARSRCVDDEGAPPLWPWTQVLARVGAESSGPAVADTGGTGTDSAAARFLLVDRLVTQLCRAAEPAGMVVVLEDLQWADEASLQVLRHLAGEIGDSRLLLVATTRVPTPPTVTAALDDAMRQPGCRTVELGPLPAAAVAEYLAACTGRPTDAALVDEVHRRTGGSPLLLRAVVPVLVETQPAPGSADVWDRVAQAADVGRLAAGLLARLPVEFREPIDIAAVLGETVDPEVLTEVSDGDQVPAALRAALGAGLLVGEGTGTAEDGGYRFSHALVRDALVAGLDPERRRDVHLQIGRRLAARSAADPSYLGPRAAHLARAGSSSAVRRELAVAAAQAAREADRRLGFEDASRWWSVAVDAIRRSGGGDADLADALIRLATAQYRAGHLGEGLATCRSAAALAGALGRADLLGRTAVVIQGVNDPDAMAAVGQWCEQALAASSEGAMDDVLLAEVLAQLACVQTDTGRPELAEQTSSRSLELARRTGDPVALLAAVQARAMISVTPAGLPELLSLGRIAISQAERTARPLTAVVGHNWRSDAAYVLGNLDAAAAEMEAVGRIAETYRLPLARWHHLRMLATRALLEGRIDEALAHSDEAFEVGNRIGDLSAAGLSGAFCFTVGELTGRPELIEGGRYEAVRRHVPTMPIMTATNALLLHQRGEDQEAAHQWRIIRGMLFDPPPDRRWLGVLTYVIELVGPMQDPEAAAEALRQLEPWWDFPAALSTTTIGFRGSFSRDLGRLHAVIGNTAQAEGLMRAGIEANARFGARPFVVRGRLELARLLGTGPEAAELARLAAREARQLGMPGPLRVADEVLAAAARAAPDPLTAREREIAMLVAQAMSNREIAAELVLSERTVESHVRNILAKLGFAGRTEIATWAVRADPRMPRR